MPATLRTYFEKLGDRLVQTIGTPIALTSLAFLVGLHLLPLIEETKGKAFPT